MLAGKLDRRIRLEMATEGPLSPRGEAPKTWALLREVWAKVELPGGREFFSGDQTAAKARVLFLIRYPHGLAVLPNPDETFRVVYEGRNYDVIEVREIGRREALEIHAEARAEAA